VRFHLKLDLGEATKVEMVKAFLKPSARRPGSSGLRTFCALWLSLVLFPSEPVQAQPTNAFTCLTNAQQVRELDPETAGKNLPVHMFGAVTYYDAPLFNLFFQDATTGIFVLVAPDIRTNIAAGQEIEVEGVSDKGDYAPIVKASAIRVLGEAHLPVPRRVPIDQLFTGLEDSQWIEVRGIVRSTTDLNGRRYLNLAMNGQRIMTYVENLSEPDAMKLINATIRLRGVCYSRYNMKRQLRVPWLAVSSLADIVVEKPPPRQPKGVSIADLAQFNSVGYYGNLVKVSGVVTLQKPDGTLFIQNQGYGLYVQADQHARLSPGDHVMISGYSGLGQYVPILENASVQFLGHGEPPSPIPADLETLLNAPENYDGLLVHLKASLMNVVESAGRQTLVLQSSNSVFTATMENTQADERLKSLKLGSQVALTGVFAARSPEKWVPGVAQSQEVSGSKIPPSSPESVQILLRSYADVSVIHQPSWWTLSRLIWMLCFMSLVLLAGMAWVVTLDRRVRQQTRIIQQKVWREGVLEERDRLAREFHDTLEQELAAINIQLGAVEAQFRQSPPIAFQQLELARNMARHSLSEARRSVWDLRSHLLENSNLATALAEMAAPLSANTGTQIAVQSFGTHEKLPALTEHNLLRITQEALVNAFKHSRAKKIVVSLNYDLQQVQLRIRDDGVGFDISTAGSANGGHFGLLDMRERAEKVGARFSISTSPGNGTEILVTITHTTSSTVANHSSLNSNNLTAPAKGELAQS
jgi:signal transduction histidine kinase